MAATSRDILDLRLAAAHGHEDTVRLLLQQNVTPIIRDEKSGEGPLHHAARGGYGDARLESQLQGFKFHAFVV